MAKVGRPTGYNDDRVSQVRSYLSECGREQTQLPTIEGLAEYMFINPDTIYEWRDKHPEFSEAIKGLLAKQKAQLMNDGMYGGKEVNSTMAIFLLKVNHGMIETEKQLIETKGEVLMIYKPEKNKE